MSMEMKYPYFLLCGGLSDDSTLRGYCFGITSDGEYALKHFRESEKDPYATGKVIILDGVSDKMALFERDILEA